MDEKFQYAILGQEDGERKLGVRPRDSTFWGKIGVLVAIFSLLIGGIIYFASREQGEEGAAVDLGSCGSTPAEAKSSGCLFDLMSWCWLHPECHDKTLSDAMLNLGPWVWYNDVGATQQVPQEVAALGEIPIMYVEESFHHIHCTYIWKKMHRAYISGRVIDSYIGSWNHTFHCSEMLLRQGIPWSQVTTSVTVKYPTCDRFRILQN